jgi:uncharacterized sporulation protein YeaH/YhbH (DUF444 family)
MRYSMSRRLALRRPSSSEIEQLNDELTALRAVEAPDIATQQRMLAALEEIEGLRRQQRAIPYIDPIDVRFNRFEPRPVPRTKAVMFCLMDVSASMGEREKDLAKRFFILLHLFLKRSYDKVEIVFIRHTHEAKEVDEKEFFYGRESGGTVVSTALKKMLEIREKRYPVADWNIYCAQASDGDNSGSDTVRCVEMLTDAILPLTQYYAYIEIGAGDGEEHFVARTSGKELWRGYAALPGRAANFAMKQVAGRAEIHPVFRELFAKQSQKRA